MKHLDLTGLAHESEAAWAGVLDLAAVCAKGWSLAGGQAVFVQTVIRGKVPDRPSTDADLVIDLRADPGAARRLTAALREIGFEATRRDGNGRMHRWIRGEAQIDVLQPRYLGERAGTTAPHHDPNNEQRPHHVAGGRPKAATWRRFDDARSPLSHVNG